MKKKYALVLEGGGAKGAYQVGAVKLLLERGYKFNAVTGTSIGSINAAFIAQGEFETLENMWKTMSYGDLFDVEQEKIEKALNINLDFTVVKYLSKMLAKSIKDKGIDTLKMRAILEKNIDEKKLRDSSVRFGLVTLCLSDKQAQELFIDEIPEGKVVDYIMASSRLPVFKTIVIDNKQYLDGGFYDNCPVHMLEKEGYTDVIAIRAYKRMRIRDYRNIVRRNKVKIRMIQPFDTLPGILNFDTNNLNNILKMGYYDAIKEVDQLDGHRYYFNPKKEDYFISRINSIDNYKELEKIVNLCKVGYIINDTINATILKRVLPYLAVKTKVKEAYTCKELIYAIVEHLAAMTDIEKYEIYEFEDFINILKKKLHFNDLNKPSQAMLRLIKLL